MDAHKCGYRARVATRVWSTIAEGGVINGGILSFEGFVIMPDPKAAQRTATAAMLIMCTLTYHEQLG